VNKKAQISNATPIGGSTGFMGPCGAIRSESTTRKEPPTQKPVVRLEQWRYWQIESPWRRRHVLSGEAFGHPSPWIDDGGRVTTSQIIGTRGSLIETQNSLYHLGEHSGVGPGRTELYQLLGMRARDAV